jgi:hypothetical protein
MIDMHCIHPGRLTGGHTYRWPLGKAAARRAIASCRAG